MRASTCFLGLVTLALAAACSPGLTADEDSTAAALLPSPEPTVRPDHRPLIYGPKSPDGLQAILGTADLAVGDSRFGFVLTSPTGFVTGPLARVTSKYFAADGSDGETRQTVDAIYQPWPYGNRGLYTVELRFDRAGRWGVDIQLEGPDGLGEVAQLRFDVEESPSAPAVGAVAIKSASKTQTDVDSLSDLTTGSLRDADLYQMTIDQAVESGRPTVLVFASPAFCTNAVCGPQVEVLQELKNTYGGGANFIHVDFYDNPQEIQGDLSKARLSPTVVEWRLPSIEWTFVIDAGGAIVARFEAFATYDEVDQALRPLL